MSTKVINVSNNLGKLLLDGWTPSDRTCLAEACHGIPLLRSPEGRNPITWFCPSCEADGSVLPPSSPSLSASTHYSRSSTPPTEGSHDLSSSTFAMPVETEESIRRRQQSDFASAEIGTRLLKGWAMLADECPRSTCYGIPLVRPPKTSRDKDPRKQCVVCGTVYVTETEQKTQGLDPLAFEGSNATVKSREKTSGSPAALAVVASASPAVGISKDKQVTHSTTPAFPATSSLSRESNLHLQTSSNHAFSEPIPTPEDILVGSHNALRTALSALSQRLVLLSGQPIIDPVTISQTADAIAKTGQALTAINTLRHSQE